MVIALGHHFPIDLCLGLIYKGDRVTTLRDQCHLKEKFNVTVPLEIRGMVCHTGPLGVVGQGEGEAPILIKRQKGARGMHRP